MFWELYQTGAMFRAQQDASDAQGRIRRAETRVRFTEHDIRQLEARVDSLALGCQAMWELLSESAGLTKQDIVDRMHDIDLRDGKADGKMSAAVSDCSACGRPVNSRRSHCIYCGRKMTHERRVFDA